MKIYFSDFFDVSPDTIRTYGAFDISLINDLPLFLDPFLLFNREKDEYRQLHSELIRYVVFLRDVSQDQVLEPGLIRAWFRFPEVKQNWFGYSLIGNSGSGLGQKFADALYRNFRTTFRNFGEEEVTRGSHLEKLTLVRSGVGRDNISDFTTNLIKGYLAGYTQEFARKHLREDQRSRFVLEKVTFNYETRSWKNAIFELPNYFGDYVLLTPRDLLTKDRTWINRDELLSEFRDIADALPNDALRAQINDYFVRQLPPKRPNEELTKKEIEEAIARAIEKFPEILDYYIREKEEEGDRAHAISEEKVRELETLFVTQLRELVKTLMDSGFYATGGNTYDEAYRRIQFLKTVIEDQDGYRLFYVNGKPVKREQDLQVIFRLTWFATPVDVNREVNNGRGPVDYKISRGSADSTLVEFKLASNSQLRKNLANQVEIYEKANNTRSSITVVMYFSDGELAKVNQILKELKLQDAKNIVLIDARPGKPSASKVS